MELRLLHLLPVLAVASPLAGLAPAHAESASTASSCAALQEALPDLVSLQSQYHDLAGAGVIDSYLADPFSALRPEANEQLTDLAQRGLASFAHFQDACQASCGALPTDGVPAQPPPQ